MVLTKLLGRIITRRPPVSTSPQAARRNVRAGAVVCFVIQEAAILVHALSAKRCDNNAHVTNVPAFKRHQTSTIDVHYHIAPAASCFMWTTVLAFLLYIS